MLRQQLKYFFLKTNSWQCLESFEFKQDYFLLRGKKNERKLN